MNTLVLSDKVVLIFGGSGGLGLALIEHIVKDKSGRVVVADVVEPPPELSPSDGVHHVRCDVRKIDDIRDAFQECKNVFDKHPDVIINCAAIVGEQDPYDLYDVNITQHHFKKHRCRVVNMSPHWIETPMMGACDFQAWTADVEARTQLTSSVRGKTLLQPREVAVKLVNALNSKNGSIWMVRPGQFHTFNIPDYQLPRKQGHFQSPTDLRLTFGLQY